MSYEYGSEDSREQGAVALARPLLNQPSVVYAGIPEGRFVSPYITVDNHPDNVIPVGEQIKLRGYYWVQNRGQGISPWWTVGMRALSSGIAVKMNKTLFSEGPLSDNDDLNKPSFPIMPNRTVTITVELWGHNDAFQTLPLP